MSQRVGLRERKKEQTRRTLWNTAIELFEKRGFDAVSVAEIAAAADVSKMTVFNYFPTKEDLVVGPMEEHNDEPARVVRERAVGESAVAALRRQFLAALAERDPATGLNDTPNVLSGQRLILTTPSLRQRAYAFFVQSQGLLAKEFAAQTGEDDLTAHIAAAQTMGVRYALVAENIRRLLDGETADAAYPGAVANAEHAFRMLETGLGDYCTRRE